MVEYRWARGVVEIQKSTEGWHLKSQETPPHEGTLGISRSKPGGKAQTNDTVDMTQCSLFWKPHANCLSKMTRGMGVSEGWVSPSCEISRIS